CSRPSCSGPLPFAVVQRGGGPVLGVGPHQVVVAFGGVGAEGVAEGGALVARRAVTGGGLAHRAGRHGGLAARRGGRGLDGGEAAVLARLARGAVRAVDGRPFARVGVEDGEFGDAAARVDLEDLGAVRQTHRFDLVLGDAVLGRFGGGQAVAAEG